PYLFRPRFSGRRDVLERVAGWQEGTRNGRGALVLIGGESGVGKTRFAMEATLRARRSQLRVVTGQCVAVPAGTSAPGSAPLYPLRPLLQAIADRCQQGGREVTEKILAHRGALLAPYESSLAHVPGQAERSVPPQLPPDAARRLVLSSLADTIAAFAAEKPLLLVLDDLQWADKLAPANDAAASYEGLPLPRSLQELISDRLARLPAAATGILEAAAVIGRQMDEALLLDAAGLGPAAGNESLDELINRQILEPGE